MSILDKIVRHKISEVEEKKNFTKETELVSRVFFDSKTISLKESLQKNAPGIIAEFKRKSPSKDNINVDANPILVTNQYEDNGAAGISVLTDFTFFQGSDKDLHDARKNLSIPILRKDFTVDTYQILEAKSIGADAILLIAAILSKSELKELAHFANSLGLEVVMEIHHAGELEKLTDHVDIIGVNNRDLKKFVTDPEHSVRLYPELPKDRVLISESGINEAATIKRLMDTGYQGFLVGEYFMKNDKPGDKLKELLEEVKNI